MNYSNPVTITDSEGDVIVGQITAFTGMIRDGINYYNFEMIVDNRQNIGIEENEDIEELCIEDEDENQIYTPIKLSTRKNIKIKKQKNTAIKKEDKQEPLEQKIDSAISSIKLD